MKVSHRFTVLLLAAAASLAPLHATRAQSPGTLDSTFVVNNLVNGRFYTELPDHKLIVSGDSLAISSPSYTRKAIVRLKEDGTIDDTFSFPGDPTTVTGHVVRPDGRILIYGSFNAVAGHTTRCVALLKEDGSVDTSFALNVNFSPAVNYVLTTTDDTCYVAFQNGKFIRIDAMGVVDPGFNPTPALNTTYYGAVLQPSGKLVMIQDSKIFRIHTDGTRDTSYKESTYTFANTDWGKFLGTPDGQVYVSSSNRKFEFGDPRTLIRLNVDGGLDPTFTFAYDGSKEGGRDVVYMALENTGKLLVTGGGMPSPFFRVLPSGLIDSTFTGYMTPTSFAFDGAGRILVNGFYIQSSPFVFRNGVMRLNNDSKPPGPQKPSLLSGPNPLTVSSGETAKFTVNAAGEQPIAFRWQFQETDIEGATSKTLDLGVVTSKNAGTYRVILSNAIGAITSAPVSLTILSAPVIKVEPVSMTVPSGIQTNLSAVVAGEQPLTLQWYRNENPVLGATGATLPFPSIAAADAGRYYLTAVNAFGAATSHVASVRVLSSTPQWLVITNATTATTASDSANPFRPDSALAIASDDVRGSVVLYAKGLERWNDAGERLWSIQYSEADFGSLNELALDADGNAYVSGMIHYTATFGSMGMTNNSSVTGPNGHVQAFIAKIDPDGTPLWYRLYEAAGPRIWGLAVDVDSGVVFAGGNGGRNGLSKLGNLAASESEYAAAVAGKLSSEGVPVWFRSFPQFTANRSTCEADSITADATGIYITGLFSFSIQFGNFNLQQVSPNASHWIGKLSSGGEPLWIRNAGGTPSQSSVIVARNGKRWFLHNRDHTLQSWTPEGAVETSVKAVFSSQNDSALINNLAVSAKGEPILVGTAVGRATVGNTDLNQFYNKGFIWFGQWNADGTPLRSRMLATATNTSPNIIADVVDLGSFTATPSGDVLLTGGYALAMKFLGSVYSAPAGSTRPDGRSGGSYIAKLRAPAFTPEITQQPIAEYTLNTGGTVKIGIRAIGPEPLTYQWRRDGIPVEGQTTNSFEFIDAKVSDSGMYDVVVSNPYGSVTTDSSKITVRPPFTIGIQPAPQLILGNQTVSGAGFDSLGSFGISMGAIAGKRLSFTITNSSSARFPVGGQFTLNLTGSSIGGTYQRPEGAVFPASSGSYFPVLQLPDDTALRLLRFSGNDMATLDLRVQGVFGLHLDIVDADGCCAQGVYTMSGGPDIATFRVQTSFFVPDGNYQWQKNGVDLPNQTASILNLTGVTSADNGLYRCIISYKNYTEVSQEAELRVYNPGGVVEPPVIPLSAFTLTADSMTLQNWPAGFVLQRTLSLSPPTWQTIATTPPATIPFAQPGEFFRLAPAP